MVGWHHRLDGHEFEQALGVGDGQVSLACCSPWGRKESDTTEPRLHFQEKHTLEQDEFCCVIIEFSSVQFSSVTQYCPTLCNPKDCSMPSIPAHHLLPDLVQTHVHQVSDTIQPSHHLSPPSPPAFNLSQHQGLYK